MKTSNETRAETEFGLPMNAPKRLRKPLPICKCITSVTDSAKFPHRIMSIYILLFTLANNSTVAFGLIK